MEKNIGFTHEAYGKSAGFTHEAYGKIIGFTHEVYGKSIGFTGGVECPYTPINARRRGEECVSTAKIAMYSSPCLRIASVPGEKSVPNSYENVPILPP